MKNTLAELSIRLDTLTIFRGILADPVISKLKTLLWLADQGEDLRQVLSVYGEFVSALYEATPDLSHYLSGLLESDENFYIRHRAAAKELSPAVETCLEEELLLLQELCSLTSEEVKKAIGYHGFLPSWENDADCDLLLKYRNRLLCLSETGYGIFARYTTFLIRDGRVEPVKYPDAQQLDELYGYEREKALILKNTEALLAGKNAGNVLLYGDAGTGKSSTIKALVNRYGKKGLRLVEVKKNQLYELPAVIETLSDNPLKFILFIDDLSFSQNDDNFSALKAILEGSVSVSGDNIAIYATSNRRHLLKESLSQREGDDLHLYETLQETGSLAARFGLTVTFQQPDRETYLLLIDQLALRYDLGHLMEDPELRADLHRKAEAHAIRTGGRTPRAAKQFIELQKIGI